MDGNHGWGSWRGHLKERVFSRGLPACSSRQGWNGTNKINERIFFCAFYKKEKSLGNCIWKLRVTASKRSLHHNNKTVNLLHVIVLSFTTFPHYINGTGLTYKNSPSFEHGCWLNQYWFSTPVPPYLHTHTQTLCKLKWRNIFSATDIQVVSSVAFQVSCFLNITHRLLFINSFIRPSVSIVAG